MDLGTFGRTDEIQARLRRGSHLRRRLGFLGFRLPGDSENFSDNFVWREHRYSDRRVCYIKPIVSAIVLDLEAEVVVPGKRERVLDVFERDILGGFRESEDVGMLWVVAVGRDVVAHISGHGKTGGH